MNGQNPQSQLNRYTKNTGYRRGFYIKTINNINIVGNLMMRITFDKSGGAYYSFYLKGKRISNAQLYPIFKQSMLLAGGVALAIILATFAEDIATMGAGIWNDAYSIAKAVSLTQPIFLMSLRAKGLT